MLYVYLSVQKVFCSLYSEHIVKKSMSFVLYKFLRTSRLSAVWPDGGRDLTSGRIQITARSRVSLTRLTPKMLIPALSPTFYWANFYSHYYADSISSCTTFQLKLIIIKRLIISDYLLSYHNYTSEILWSCTYMCTYCCNQHLEGCIG
jgi:hypothetical protein